ncbi:Predicted unusual protein kinase regulating ubiquinone biosynthesis, AarF/ABC1/UbiB family [Rhodococcus maanshanensis]|uniref:Predicted unusual protein kinase regulating ubiquinone biosynthesis, AarF/ABC1/UbiB family n=2 Tax=Rhodococcus maanshanensis TaxID=183556 RepID=A0A1H7WLZ9_9NOCA|nr:AarF/UbiB family protein [Rhodococcus maanshanensis]SEM22069.1 Predicted unusual protein kinase regulating ubiquinone biosynthesis, AarF/ABC1/UbiB family [Rhodococcus maanshanensis]
MSQSNQSSPVGPYASGPPAAALSVHMPDLNKFGPAQLWRALVVGVVIIACAGYAVLTKPFLRRGETWADAASEGVVNAFEALGPTFVKLGQLMASSSGVFPAPLANACLRCLDDVPPVSARKAREVIEGDLGGRVDEIFASFDDEPLAAASVAQVHACVLPDGREAVIKVQRPGIYHRMLVDLRTAYGGAKLLERLFEFFRIANATAIIRDLHAATMTELNSAVEADRQTRFRDAIWAFGDNKGVTAPEVYWDYCGPHVICMERLHGVPLDRFVPDADHDTTMLIRRGVKAWIESITVHGPFHGDVHAGNLWALDDGRIAFLDFGIVGELPEVWRSILRDMFYANLIDGDFARVARGIRDLGYTAEVEAGDAEIGMQVAAVLAPVFTNDLAELNLGALIMALVQLGKQWGVASPEELVLFGKQLGYFERYATRLAPGWVIGKDPYLFRNVFPEAVAERVATSGVALPDD